MKESTVSSTVSFTFIVGSLYRAGHIFWKYQYLMSTIVESHNRSKSQDQNSLFSLIEILIRLIVLRSCKYFIWIVLYHSGPLKISQFAKRALFFYLIRSDYRSQTLFSQLGQSLSYLLPFLAWFSSQVWTFSFMEKWLIPSPSFTPRYLQVSSRFNCLITVFTSRE